MRPIASFASGAGEKEGKRTRERKRRDMRKREQGIGGSCLLAARPLKPFSALAPRHAHDNASLILFTSLCPPQQVSLCIYLKKEAGKDRTRGAFVDPEFPLHTHHGGTEMQVLALARRGGGALAPRPARGVFPGSGGAQAGPGPERVH